MNATEAFVELVASALESQKAERYAALASTEKGRTKILLCLCHEFEHAIRPEAVQRSCEQAFWNLPCYAYSSSLGFGQPFSRLREAIDRLGTEDSWLIVLQDGSGGIHRPEGRWDGQKIIVPGLLRRRRDQFCR
jgi:hypothetical protein